MRSFGFATLGLKLASSQVLLRGLREPALFCPPLTGPGP